MINRPTHHPWIPRPQLPDIQDGLANDNHLNAALRYRFWVEAGVRDDKHGAIATQKELCVYIYKILRDIFPPPPAMVNLQEIVQQAAQQAANLVLGQVVQAAQQAAQEATQAAQQAMQAAQQATQAAHEATQEAHEAIQAARQLAQQVTQQAEQQTTFRDELARFGATLKSLCIKTFNGNHDNWQIVPNAAGEYPPANLPRLTSMLVAEELGAEDWKAYRLFYQLPEGVSLVQFLTTAP